MRYSFDSADAPTTKERRYYAMLGTRGIWEQGWKAVAVHGPTSGIGNFDQDEWQLFHTDDDRSEAHDLAQEHPDKLKQLIDAWFEEAEKFEVLPLDDRLPHEILQDPRPHPRRDLRHGSRFGGHTLFLKDKELWYVYNFLGIAPEQQFVSETIEPGKHVLGMEFVKVSVGEHGKAHGTATLHVDEDAVATGPMRAQLAQFTLCGDGLCVGRDSADAVSKEYTSPARFKGGTIVQVEVNVDDDQYVDLEKQAAAMLARE
jgi:hypothetical protein